MHDPISKAAIANNNLNNDPNYNPNNPSTESGPGLAKSPTPSDFLREQQII